MDQQNLKGGCYVLAGVFGGGLQPLIDARHGAKHLSQYFLGLKGGASPIYSFGKSDVLVFILAGEAAVTISGHTFKATPEAGLYIGPGEAFAIKGDASLLVTVCPEAVAETLDAMPDNFDETYPERMVAPDPKKREEMGERYYQVLVSKNVGSEQVTQFIGEIPKSKAPSHHHLYEEALYVLGGEGFMWTEDVKAPVFKGSIIFLPKRQQHSLECTSDEGLRVVGHFYPAGSPGENY